MEAGLKLKENQDLQRKEFNQLIAPCGGWSHMRGDEGQEAVCWNLELPWFGLGLTAAVVEQECADESWYTFQVKWAPILCNL